MSKSGPTEPSAGPLPKPGREAPELKKQRRLSRTKPTQYQDDSDDFDEVENIDTTGRGRAKAYGNKAAAAYPQAPTLDIGTIVRLKAPAAGQPTGECQIVRSDTNGKYKIKDLNTGEESPTWFTENELYKP